MLNSVDFSGRPFHFIGIGGIGMSALAYVLTQRQLPVSGSDLRLSHLTQRLQEAGARIFWQHAADNLRCVAQALDRAPANGTSTSPLWTVCPPAAVPALPQVICSTAINESNPEYQAAKQLGCPIFHRSDLLAALMHQYRSIAVAGTHGKTTTSSMMGYALLEAGIDPTIVVGGEVSAWQGNARTGSSDWFVAEADESDGSLVKLAPEIGIITNIELDHPDHYNTLDEVIGIFRHFADQPQVLIASADCATIRRSLTPDVTYSIEPDQPADYTVSDLVGSARGFQADIWEQGERLGRLCLAVPGRHNLSNALAVIAAGRQIGLPFEPLAASLSKFEGARRRFERRGQYRGIQFIDDYAHHPSEIRATLSAARLQKHPEVPLSPPVKRIFAVFQPHRYSRTQAFLEDFSRAFADADTVIVTDIYSAGEENPYGISGEQVAQAIATYHPQVHYCPTLEAVQAVLVEQLEPGDMALFLGAGNLNRVIPDVMEPFMDEEARAVQRA